MRNRPIGIFDSGVGGLTVVKELAKEMPDEDMVYFGDTARVPYGTKSPSTIMKFSTENILYLLKFNVKLIIIACNTSSAIGLPFLSRYFRIPIIGVIKPGAKAAVRLTCNGNVGVIGTNATVSSRAYEKEIRSVDPRIKVHSKSCPLFVPLVEEGWAKEGVVNIIAKKYLAPLKGRKIDTLILGCTHYPLLRSCIQGVVGRSVRLVDSAQETVKEAKGLLDECALRAGNKRRGRSRFYVSDEPERFRALAKKFLGRNIEAVEKVRDV